MKHSWVISGHEDLPKMAVRASASCSPPISCILTAIFRAEPVLELKFASCNRQHMFNSQKDADNTNLMWVNSNLPWGRYRGDYDTLNLAIQLRLGTPVFL